MIARHPTRWLAAFCDGQLPEEKARAIAAHLEHCEQCRRERDDILFATRLLRELPLAHAPDEVWRRVEQHLEFGDVTSGVAWSMGWKLAAMAAVLMLLIAGLTYRQLHQVHGATWEVTMQTAGGSRTVQQPAGAWIETSPSARAHVRVGTIGAVDVEPQTRLRLGPLDTNEYRLALDRGAISAKVTAPPRLFVVDTPASTLIDLGCAYHVQVDAAGTGMLTVTEGWTSLEWHGRESMVPAGASSPMNRGSGPGIPSFDDASSALKAALARLDRGDDNALDTVLSEARVRDTLSLWHTLQRVPAERRETVLDRLQSLVPMPAGVTREQALRLDADALRKWREEMAWKW